MSLKPLWHHHPHVRSGTELTLSERAADQLKRWFGTWTALGVVAAGIVLWLTFAVDPGELLLNLSLSCIAAVQGIVLQIAQNRGDRISSELAIATHRNGEKLLEINTQQLAILNELKALRADMNKDGE